MTPRPTVLTHDTHDDRRQAFTAVLRGFTPAARLDFLDWCCNFARLTVPQAHMLRAAKADRVKMLPLTTAAERRDEVADLRHSNEIYMDITVLAHNWGVEWLPMVLELEHRAMGREPTPPAVAARAWLSRTRGPSAAASIRTPGTCGSARPVRFG